MMEKKRRVFWGMVMTAIAGIFLLSAQAAYAAKSSPPPKPAVSIPEESQPWKGLPWVIGGFLSAGVIAVGVKNAKRTHLD
jgi:hypothetical protein